MYRQACMVLTRNAGLRICWDGDIHVFIDFYPPDRRRVDDDNLSSRFKAGRDGVADALVVDDRRFRAHPCLRDEVRAGGEVVLTVRENQAERFSYPVNGHGVVTEKK